MTNDIFDIATNCRYRGIILKSFEVMSKSVFIEIGCVGSYNFVDYKNFVIAVNVKLHFFLVN